MTSHSQQITHSIIHIYIVFFNYKIYRIKPSRAPSGALKLIAINGEAPFGEGGMDAPAGGDVVGVALDSWGGGGWASEAIGGGEAKLGGGGGGETTEGEEGGKLGALALLFLSAITTTTRDSFLRQLSWFPLMK